MKTKNIFNKYVRKKDGIYSSREIASIFQIMWILSVIYVFRTESPIYTIYVFIN